MAKKKTEAVREEATTRKFRVVFKRSFVEYGTIVVEAEDESEARDAAKDLLDEADWTQQELDEEEHESTEKIDT